MFKRTIAIILLLSVSNSCFAEASISNYVSTLISQSFVILKDKNKNIQQKRNDSETLMTANMDLEWMSKFVLGRHRRQLTPEQLADFTKLYSSYVVKTYSNGVKSFNNQDVKVKAQQNLSTGEYIVKTLLLRESNEPLHMDYLVRETKTGLKVFDVVTEGISLINSHQAEFANTISNQNFEFLMNELHNKIKSLDK